MHDNTYIWTNDAQKLLKMIVEGIASHQQEQGESIKEWNVLLYDNRNNNIPEIPHTAILVRKINGEEKRTCLSLHAYKRIGAEENRQIIVVTPHFWTSYVEKNTYSYSELEDLLKNFDSLIETYFAAYIYEIQKL